MYSDYESKLNNALNEAKCQQAQTKAQYADCASGVLGTAVVRPYSLAEQLEKSAAGSYQQGSDYTRASGILRAHPEFEEFIWLIRSGLV